MSYGVMAFAVDWDDFLGLFGCGDKELADELTEEWAEKRPTSTGAVTTRTSRATRPRPTPSGTC